MRASFVFDLDSTILKGEILPALAARFLGDSEMAARTMESVMGRQAFSDSFPARVARLRTVSVRQAAEAVRELPRYEELCDFLRTHRARCWIATGNLDVWIGPLLEELGMTGRCAFAVARVEADRVAEIRALPDKAAFAAGLPRPVVAVGDGMNDLPMLEAADFGIAFAASHPVPAALRRAADCVIAEERALLLQLEALDAECGR